MTYTVNVASNVCGELLPTIPVNIDCSLCALGFPQAGGFIAIAFYGPICAPSPDPSPSWWLGSALKQAQWRCINPGPNAEPDPNTWVASGTFGSIATTSGCARQYRFRATLTVINTTTIQVAVAVDVLTPTVGGNHWVSYVSWSETLHEIVGTDTTAYRGRNFSTVGYTPITVDAVGGTGDPVSYARIIVGLQSMRLGCGGNGDVCGFWDGSQWLTCLRGFIKSTTDNSIREFVQLGFNTLGCGTVGGTPCGCDRFTLTSTSPPSTSPSTPVNNLDPAFVTNYGVLGLPGGVETVGAQQQIQVGPATTAGIQVVAKQVAGGPLYICTNDNGAGWICSAAVVAQAKGPRILTATRADFEVHLYALNFPNDNLLPAECYENGGIPAPGAGDPYWCVDGACVQSLLQPAGAYGGPYDTSEECTAVCVGITPPDPTPDPANDPWWCVDNSGCVQSSTAPPGGVGPYSTPTDCELACPAGATEPGWYCVYVDSLWQCLYYADRPAGHTGVQFFSFAACIPSCNSSFPPPPDPDPTPSDQYYCVEDELGNRTCQLAASAPAGTISGPYATSGDCSAACTPLGSLRYWCASAADGSLACALSATAPPSWISGPYLSLATCNAACIPPTPEGVAPAAMLQPEPTPAQAEAQRMLAAKRQPLTPYQLQLIERAKHPCKHRGEFIAEANCGCSGKKLYACSLHGKCRLMPNTGDGDDIKYCDRCDDYAK